jgi:Ca2+-binding RTX toxin-like protein
VNLLQQRATRSGEEDTLIDVEAFFGSQAGDTFVGAEAAEHLRSDTVRGGRGNDTLDGGGGVDTAEYLGNYAAFSVQRTGSRLVVTDLFNPQGGEGVDQLNNFERVIFADKMLAFGSRAEEVARVAFVLWTPEIVRSSTLFSRGLSFYDVGYDFNFLCVTALQFWPQQGQDFAQMLVNNTRGTSRTVADVLAIMNAAGPGDTGRAAAVAAMALDPAMTQLITLSGVLSTGVVADLVVPDFGTLFELLPG